MPPATAAGGVEVEAKTEAELPTAYHMHIRVAVSIKSSLGAKSRCLPLRLLLFLPLLVALTTSSTHSATHLSLPLSLARGAHSISRRLTIPRIKLLRQCQKASLFMLACTARRRQASSCRRGTCTCPIPASVVGCQTTCNQKCARHVALAGN